MDQNYSGKIVSNLPNPALGFHFDRKRLYRRGGKRLFDVTLVLLSLPILVPLLTIIAALISATGTRPLFWHNRIGRDGKMFKCLKFRTMVRDADRRLAEHLANNRQAESEWAACQKLSKDPRVTVLGQFLRASSLDELPQIWNILVGDMSLVGPRPVTKAELKKYGTAVASYLSARPGLTGAWQISDKRNGVFLDRVPLDLKYLRNSSFVQDLRIIFSTFGVVIRNTGQ